MRREPPPGSDPTERFTVRAEAYRRYRPGYPPALVETVLAAAPAGLDPTQGGSGAPTVVDLGSGTGLSAEPFLRAGCTVYGVEPNAAMRTEGEDALRAWPTFFSVDGTAEATTLPTGLAQVITAGQALHWFRLDAARAEIGRIAAHGAVLAIFWNTRAVDASPFMSAYEALIKRHAVDYQAVRHDRVGEDSIRSLFAAGPEPVRRLDIAWHEWMDQAALIGRTRSASYLPAAGPALDALHAELEALFVQHAVVGGGGGMAQGRSVVRMAYVTQLWVGPAPAPPAL